MPKHSKEMPARNKFFADDKRAKGFNQSGIPSKNPDEAQPTTGARETPAERADNALREDKGA